MSDEARFDVKVTCEVSLPGSEYATRSFEISGSVVAPVENAPDWGVTAARRAMKAAGDYAAMFPPDGTRVDWGAGT